MSALVEGDRIAQVQHVAGIVGRVIREQDFAVAGPPSREGMAVAIANELLDVGLILPTAVPS